MMKSKRDYVLSNEYVAGLFDGEGCVFAYKKRSHGKYGDYKRIILRMKITSTNFKLLVMLKKWLGSGTLTKKNEKRKRSNGGMYKECYDWTVTGKENMLKFISRVKPFVIEKDYPLSLARHFCKTMHPPKSGGKKITAQEHRIREDVLNKLKGVRTYSEDLSPYVKTVLSGCASAAVPKE